jgi:hypothetical protein
MTNTMSDESTTISSADYFPLSKYYAKPTAARNFLLRESSSRGRAFAYTERHVQAVWFDPKWRPNKLTTSQGEDVIVEYPGHWNLEAGPDFLGATLCVGPDRRRITGDVEVHVFPADWKNHHHLADPRYRNICAHVTFFDGLLDETQLPPGVLQVSLRSSLKANATFAFEHIDVSAYPYAGRADIPPCRNILHEWPVEKRQQLLTAAGHERMRMKADRFSGAIRERGIDQVVYEAVMAALGYQHNKHPFLDLASRLPVDRLRNLASGNQSDAYALLLGMSGLIPHEMDERWDDETRRYVRSLWDVWWKKRIQLPEPMSRRDWQLHQLRPLNHPIRRLVAAATMFVSYHDGNQLIKEWLSAVLQGKDFFANESGESYWNFHASLGGDRSDSTVAIVGRDRQDAMALNILIPLAAACGFDSVSINHVLETTRAEPLNHIMKQTVFYLFGPDHPSSLYRTALQRQGLQQIFHDYCLHDRSVCSRCLFPDLIRGLT